MLKQAFSVLPSSPIALEPKPLFHQVAQFEKHVFVSEEDDERSVESLEDIVFEEDNTERDATKGTTPIASNVSSKKHLHDTKIASKTSQKCFVPLKHLPPSFHQSGKENSFRGARKNLFPACHIDKKERPLVSSNQSKAMASAPDLTASRWSSLPVAVAVATPVLPSPLQESCCESCCRKDHEAKRQAKEIAQLQHLLTQMVVTLGEALGADAAKPEPPSLASSVSPTSATCSTSDISHDCASERSESSHAENNYDFDMSEHESKSSQTDTCFLRLCRAKAERQQKGSPGDHQIATKRLRHVPIIVAGIAGFYSGPPMEECLLGCVIRFENGDQYLGELRRVDAESECTMELHGNGTLYRKDGSIVRGRFWHNKVLA